PVGGSRTRSEILIDQPAVLFISFCSFECFPQRVSYPFIIPCQRQPALHPETEPETLSLHRIITVYVPHIGQLVRQTDHLHLPGRCSETTYRLSLPLFPCQRFVLTLLRHHLRDPRSELPLQHLPGDPRTVFDRIVQHRCGDDLFVIRHCRNDRRYLSGMYDIRSSRPFSELSLMCFRREFHGFTDHKLTSVILPAPSR